MLDPVAKYWRSSLSCAPIVAMISACAPIPTGECAEKGLCASDASATADSTSSGGGGDAGDAAARDACAQPEDCTNGLDDNCDGLVDCSDPACGAFVCIDAPPAGWTGPLALDERTGNPAAPASSCVGAYSKEVLDGASGALSAPAATCGCTCAPSTGLCGFATVQFYGSADCTGSPCGSRTSVDCNGTLTSCITAIGSVSVGVPAPTASSCPATPTRAVPPATWTATARACGLAGPPRQGGCPADQVCVPRPTSPFAPALCIGKPGADACPSPGTYSARRTYGAVIDTRGCTACTCGAPASSTCTSQLTFASDWPICKAATSTPVGAPVACAALPATTTGVNVPMTRYIPSTCSASTSTPNGTVSNAESYVACCAP